NRYRLARRGRGKSRPAGPVGTGRAVERSGHVHHIERVISRAIVADDDETKPTALVLRPHFLCVVPRKNASTIPTMPSSAILPSFSAPTCLIVRLKLSASLCNVRTLHVQTDFA